MKKQIVNFITSPLLVIFILAIVLFLRNFQEIEVQKPKQNNQVIEILKGAK